MKKAALLAASLFVLGCSGNDGGPDPDGPLPAADTGAGADKGGVLSDQGVASPDQRPGLPDHGQPDIQTKPDALTAIQEQEPNDGSTPTELNHVTWPTLVKGAIGTPGDIDIFSIAAQAGDQLALTVKSGGTLEPHLVLFDPGKALPTVANAGTGEVLAEYYVLESATLYIGVRDRRNVGPSPKNVGGPAFTYTLSIQNLGRAPTAVTVDVAHSATLAPRGTIHVLAFNAQPGLEMQLAVKAKQLTAPSDVDSRLSLFHPGQKAWLGTNDDLSLSQSDSLLKGQMPFTGTYHAIVENVNLDAVNLAYSFLATTIK